MEQVVQILLPHGRIAAVDMGKHLFQRQITGSLLTQKYILFFGFLALILVVEGYLFKIPGSLPLLSQPWRMASFHFFQFRLWYVFIPATASEITSRRAVVPANISISYLE